MITINGKDYKELRCAKCQAFVIYQNVTAGALAIRCHKCEYMNEWMFKYLKADSAIKEMQKDYQIEMREPEGGDK